MHATDVGSRVGFPAKKLFPKRTRILSIPSEPHSFHSVHSAPDSRMNGMIFRSFRKWNSSQKNTNTVYSEYSYSGIVPKERALRLVEIEDNHARQMMEIEITRGCQSRTSFLYDTVAANEELAKAIGGV